MRKNLLFIAIALLGMSLGANAQKIASGNLSYVTYYLCDIPGSPMALGLNTKGQLGDGTIQSSTVPVQPAGLSNITAMAGGKQFSLFRKDDGTVWSCGENPSGQLGEGTYTGHLTPVQISTLSGVVAVAAGEAHSLFLKDDGTVWATGSNYNGELGDGSGLNKVNIPVQVAGITGITAIAAGEDFSLFLKNDGTVWACGRNFAGQLGDGTTTNRPTPVQVSELSDITAIAAGSKHSLFLKSDGTVWACGQNNTGQLGDQSYDNRYTAVQVTGLEGITAISAGSLFSFFLKNDGFVWACGSNNSGVLGNGTTNPTYVPVQVSDINGVTAVAAGASHALLLKSDGSIWGCGSNAYGNLGEEIANYTLPIEVISASDCSGTSVEEVNNQFMALTVYPNPANNSIFIQMESDQFTGKKNTVKIYSAVGQEVLQSTSYWDHTSIDISSLSSGIYFIRLFDGENQRQGKFVKE